MSIHRYFLHNGKIREASEASLFRRAAGAAFRMGCFQYAAGSRRRAVRMGKALGSHVARCPAVECRNAGGSRCGRARYYSASIDANRAPDCTLRLVVVRNSGGLWQGPSSGLATDTIVLTADLKNWGESVRLTIQPHARYAASEFTSAKILSWAANLRWAERAQEQGFDEVILLNETGACPNAPRRTYSRPSGTASSLRRSRKVAFPASRATCWSTRSICPKSK